MAMRCLRVPKERVRAVVLVRGALVKDVLMAVGNFAHRWCKLWVVRWEAGWCMRSLGCLDTYLR